MKRWAALIAVTLLLGVAIFLSLDLFGNDLFAVEGREATQLFLRLVAVIAVQYVPLVLLSFRYKRWWWTVAVVLLFVSLTMIGAGGTDADVVILLAAPYLASLLSLLSPRIVLDGDGIRTERLNSEDAKSFWD